MMGTSHSEKFEFYACDNFFGREVVDLGINYCYASARCVARRLSNFSEIG